MRQLILATALGALALSTAQAASLTLTLDGKAMPAYTLQSLNIDSGGNVTVSASGGTTTSPTPTDPTPTDPTPTDPTPTDPTPTDPTPTDPTPTDPATGCTSSSTLTCVDTKLPSSPFSRVAYKPDPKMVYAFKVTAPTGAYYGSGTATRQVGANSAKLIVISETPGDVTTTGKSYGCVAQGTESTRIDFAINKPSASIYIYCPMTAGKTYYINVSSYSKSNPGSLTCDSPSNCGFYFEGR
ncbi:hypothetical protein [Thauera chlorobenzoica]|uniref:hypothetical protein n=1 Tax=Thauera chlorobenzoica TaxID=96773 RepID=UPI00089FC60D|nr:hypothetical protein [Thauera chlorobenzoica]SEF66676.1 hypothetical protein SAMN05216242_103211 [Thauera chlorobenzoica]